MFVFKYIADLVNESERTGKAISEIVWQWEIEQSDYGADHVWQEMKDRLGTIKEAANIGVNEKSKTFNNLVGGDAYRVTRSEYLLGSTSKMAMAYALAVSEVNANMGKIVACPTAGSCGIVPGALLATADLLQCNDDRLIRALFTAAGIGKVIASNASVSGAVGGCQAECGSAAAMAAGAVVEMLGGTPAQLANAVALALKNVLGLVCDPVAGLVEVPCVKRNGFLAVHALVAAEMALSGVESVIPADEVIDAMYRIGLAIPSSLRETSEAGLAKTPTAVCITERLGKK
jgi:L-serine dehydratase